MVFIHPLINSAEFFIIPLMVGFLLDIFIGDPRWAPHPVIWFGKLISKGEDLLNIGRRKKYKGAVLSIVLVVGVFLFFMFLQTIVWPFDKIYFMVASLFIFYSLANRTLIKEALKVEDVLGKDGLQAGRKQLSYIVGRDTSSLDKKNIRKAVLETISENLSDGVFAPLFYYMIGGFPLMITYKMVNTLDSMIGYKNERYRDFGWFAAKMDDVFNFLPARITALFMAMVALRGKPFLFIFSFAKKHSSPNAGYPEAALAGILDCQFGGPNVYHGKMMDKPFIGVNDRDLTRKDIEKAGRVNIISSLLFLLLLILGGMMVGRFI